MNYKHIFLEIKGRITKNYLLKNIFLVSGGTAFAQILTTVTTPIVTRIYTTSEYGILTTFNSILSILGLVGALKYELSIPIADNEEEAKDCLTLSSIVLIVTTVVITIAILLGGKSFLELFGATDLFAYWYMIPLGIFLVQLFAIYVQYSYRNKDFKTISKTTIKQSVVGNAAKILLGLGGIGPIGLLLSRVMSESVGTISLMRPVLKGESFESIFHRKIGNVGKRYIKFPLFQFPSTILGQLATNMPVFFLGALYGSDTVGAFGLANTVVNLSMDLIGKSVGNVFYAEAAQIGKKNPEALKKLSNSILRKMALLGLVPLMVLVLAGPYLFAICFGRDWRIAGEYARIMALSTYVSFVFSPVSRVYEVYEKQKMSLILCITKTFLLVLVFSLARIWILSVYSVIVGYVIVISVMSLLTYIMAQKYMRTNNS